MITSKFATLARLLTLAAFSAAFQMPQQRTAAPTPVLVSTDWLSEHLRDEKLVVLHVGNENSFAAGHVPGGRLMTPAIFAPEKNGLSTEMPDSTVMREILQAAGVSNDSRIIIVSSTHPPTLAARLYVTLDHFGLAAQTSLLDGGMRAWTAEKRIVSTDPAATARGTVSVKQRSDLLVDHLFVTAHLADASTSILDARDIRFFTGEQQNTQRAARPGRVPGAHNVVYSSLVAESGLMLGRDSIAKVFSAAGIPAGKQVVTYCHVGQQASLAFLAARIAGYDVHLYDGSYEDWSKRPELRVETGVPPR